jgi:hypothetical protein
MYQMNVGCERLYILNHCIVELIAHMFVTQDFSQLSQIYVCYGYGVILHPYVYPYYVLPYVHPP